MKAKSAMEKQIQAIEAKLKPRNPEDTTLWFMRLLQDAGANEDALNAASYMAAYDVLDRPTDIVWERLEARFKGDCENWPDSRLIFAVINADFDFEDEIFLSDEGKDGLCWAAQVCFNLFDKAPLPADPGVRQDRSEILFSEMIVPWLTAACPELSDRSDDTYRDWLESVRDTDEDELLGLLRAFATPLKDEEMVSV